MGMSIDTVTKWLGIIRANFKVFPEVGSNKKIESLDTAISYLGDYKQLQADYENRLNADKVAMLIDIQSEFKEGLRCKGCCNNCVNACEDIPAGWFLDFIDAKINLLKENTDGNDD